MEKQKLPFPLEEFKERLTKVRLKMEERAVNSLLITAPENIYYLTGYHTLGYFSYQLLVVPLKEDPILLTRHLNVENAQVSSWLTCVEGYLDTENPNDATYKVLDKYDLLDKSIGTQNSAWFFTIAQYLDLKRRLGNGNLVDCSGVVEQVRLIKSKKEIEYMKKASQACAASLDGAIEAIAPGQTENDVTAACHKALFEAGSEYLGHPPMVVAGPAAGLAFATWNRRPIGNDDVVYLEAGGTFERYNTALSRTVMVGNPDKKWIKMAEISKEALNLAIEAIKPGVTSSEVDWVCREHIRKAGYAEYFQHRTGYSIGIGFPPDWGEGRTQSIKEGDPIPLQPGMVFHLIPDLKVINEGGVVFSETVLVTEKGHETLVNYRREIFFK